MKTETPEHLAARHAKEQAELLRLQRIQSKPTVPHYFFILMLVITVIYIMDEITSSIGSSMQVEIIFDLFHVTSMSVDDPAYKDGLATLGLTGIVSGLFFILSPFYKSLADRFGRRPFMAINTCGFALGLFTVMTAPNLVVYVIGAAIVQFVIPNDVQIMYIMEVAPKEHRAKLCSITKAIALMAVSLIGVMRRVFFIEGSMKWWRNVYFLPVVVCVTVAVLSIFFIRETPVFLSQRIRFLSKTDEERAAEARAAKQSENTAQGGVLNAFRFIFRHKQTRFLAISAILFYATTIYTSHYTTIMQNGGMTTEQTSLAILIFPFANGIITFISGFLADRLGRKTTSLILGVSTMLTLAAFILSCQLGWGPVAAGVLYGVSIGCLWSMSDCLLFTMPAESVPTSIRASVMGTMSLLLAIGAAVSGIIVALGQRAIDIGWLCFGICVPFMALSLFILATKVHETKGVDMDAITGTEWD